MRLTFRREYRLCGIKPQFRGVVDLAGVVVLPVPGLDGDKDVHAGPLFVDLAVGLHGKTMGA